MAASHWLISFFKGTPMIREPKKLTDHRGTIASMSQPIRSRLSFFPSSTEASSSRRPLPTLPPINTHLNTMNNNQRSITAFFNRAGEPQTQPSKKPKTEQPAKSVTT
jgi:hypothetical protein